MNIDNINSSSQITFGYKSVLKTLFQEGEMPTVKRGLYGNPINNKNVSLEHLKPHSKGGRSTLSNFALADKTANSARGNRPLAEFLDKEMLEGYLSQFNFRIGDEFNGFQYQEMMRRTCDSLRIPNKLPAKAREATKVVYPTKEKVPLIDYGNLKDVMANLDKIAFRLLPKKILKCLRNKGILK